MLGDLNKLYTVVNPQAKWVGQLKGDHYIRKNFQVAEFACSDGSGIILVNSDTLDACQKIRDAVGDSITINSANRTAQYNKDIGGAEKSYHVTGDAVDISIPGGYTKKTFLDVIETALSDKIAFMGIGIYDTFIHIDCRGYKARWEG